MCRCLLKNLAKSKVVLLQEWLTAGSCYCKELYLLLVSWVHLCGIVLGDLNLFLLHLDIEGTFLIYISKTIPVVLYRWLIHLVPQDFVAFTFVTFHKYYRKNDDRECIISIYYQSANFVSKGDGNFLLGTALHFWR